MAARWSAFRAGPYPAAADQRGGDGDEIPGPGREDQRQYDAEGEGAKRSLLAPAADRAMFAPAADMRAEMLVIQQPGLKARAGAGEAEGGEDHERNGGQQRQEGADRAEADREEPCDEIEVPPHGVSCGGEAWLLLLRRCGVGWQGGCWEG